MSNQSLFLALPDNTPLERIGKKMLIDLLGPMPVAIGPMQLYVEGRGRKRFEPYSANDKWSVFLSMSSGRYWNDVRVAIALSIFWMENRSGNNGDYLCWLDDGTALFYAQNNTLLLNEDQRSYVKGTTEYDPGVKVKWVNLPNVGLDPNARFPSEALQ